MGLGTPCLSVVLAQARVPIEGGCLPVCKGPWGEGVEGGGGEFTRHGHELAPASSSRGARDPADVPQYRLNLLLCTVCNLGAEGLNRCWVPLSCPAAGHKIRLVRDDEQGAEFAAQLQRRAWGEPVYSDSEVQGTPRTRMRGARAGTEDMGLRPEPTTDRASTYLGVL